MTLNQSALLELTDVLRTADGGQVMRLMLSAMLQALVDAEATARIGCTMTWMAARVPDSSHESTAFFIG